MKNLQLLITRTIARFSLCALLATLFALSPVPSHATPKFMPASQVRPGMQGYGLTVFQGRTISRFPVKVIGIIPNEGPGGGRMILVRVSGPEIEDNGGIALGMSGSPVYIKDQLIGAVSTTFPMTDHLIGGVTPAEDMFGAGIPEKKATPDKPGKKTGSLPHRPVRIAGRSYRAVRPCSTSCPPGLPPDILPGKSALTPIAISGVSERAFNILKRHFSARGIEVLPRIGVPAGLVGRPSDVGGSSPLRPGDAVAIQLVRGPIDISAVGTVTAVDGDRLYAFGHSFFHRGAVEYLMSDAYVHATVPGEDVPFKIASPGSARGTFTEDRGAVVRGVIGRYPQLIPMNITVEDKDTGRKRGIPMRLVQDRELMRDLVVTILLQAIDQTIDRVGPGTSHISFQLNTRGVDGDVSRNNMYYSADDISARSLGEIMALVEILTRNRLRDTEVLGIDIKVTVDNSHSVATIEKAEISDSPSSASLSDNKSDSDSDPSRITPGAGKPDDTTGADPKNADAERKKNPKKLKFKWPPENAVPGSPPPLAEPVDNLPRVHPGDKIPLRVTLRPYRRDPVEETLFLKVPDDISVGAAVINVYSGTKFMEPSEPGDFVINIKVEQPEDRDKSRSEPEEDKVKSLDDIVSDFTSRDANNDLVATIASLAFSRPRDSQADDEESDEPATGPDKNRARKHTSWVLNGSANIRVRVEDNTSLKDRKIRRSRINALGSGADNP